MALVRGATDSDRLERIDRRDTVATRRTRLNPNVRVGIGVVLLVKRVIQIEANREALVWLDLAKETRGAIAGQVEIKCSKP